MWLNCGLLYKPWNQPWHISADVCWPHSFYSCCVIVYSLLCLNVWVFVDEVINKQTRFQLQPSALFIFWIKRLGFLHRYEEQKLLSLEPEIDNLRQSQSIERVVTYVATSFTRASKKLVQFLHAWDTDCVPSNGLLAVRNNASKLRRVRIL